MNGETNEEVHVKFMDRDLTNEEVQECMKRTHEYIRNDSYEIEIQNLNEVNEYFRLFKDMIVEKDQRHMREINDLRRQVESLKSKIDLASDHAFSAQPSYGPKLKVASRYSQENEEMQEQKQPLCELPT